MPYKPQMRSLPAEQCCSICHSTKTQAFAFFLECSFGSYPTESSSSSNKKSLKWKKRIGRRPLVPILLFLSFFFSCSSSKVKPHKAKQNFFASLQQRLQQRRFERWDPIFFKNLGVKPQMVVSGACFLNNFPAFLTAGFLPVRSSCLTFLHRWAFMTGT